MLEPRAFAADALILAHGADRCELLPQVGGSLGGWTVQGQEMLRAASTASIAARDPFGMASFPLVPYSNRIGNAQFEWDGKVIRLTRNFPPEPHSIHGVGFERPWQCTERTAETALFTLFHRPDARWPWAFEASQRVTIAERKLTLELSAVNREPHPVPLAFGHHPYLPQRGAHLTFDAREVWLAGPDGLPSERVKPSGQFDFSQATPVNHIDIDNCFTGWSGSAYVTWTDKPWALQISGSRTLPSAVVYIRSGTAAFCFEPVPHLNNALNLQGSEPAMPVVAPGEAFKASIRFRAVAR